MNQFANALGKKFVENKDAIRIRSFELGGHTFKVKVPLTADHEAMMERIKIVDDAKIEQYYKELSKSFIDAKETFKKEKDVEFTENDVILKGTSIRDTAKNKVITENRILELFKLIVPEEKDFDMNTITYEMIEELFPFSVQLQVIEEINEVISPTYKASKGKSSGQSASK